MSAERWLADRIVLKRGRVTRWTGRSSDALAIYALGRGPRPQAPGHPDRPGGMCWHSEECGRGDPMDESDLLACTITYLTAPDDLKPRMAPVLAEMERWVWHGINRHGEKLTKGTRDFA